MIAESVNGRAGATVLTGMIVSDTVCGAVAAIWDKAPDGLLASRWENIVGGWCVSYYRKYRKAPGPATQTMYDRWAETNGRDRDTVALVEKFLRNLSQNYAARKRGVNPQFVIDQANDYFVANQARSLMEEMSARLAGGDTAGIRKLLAEYRPVEVGIAAEINPLRDREFYARAFAPESVIDLIAFPGAMGNFFKRIFLRDGFVGLEGMAKVGKSFWLMYILFMALLSKRRVAFFETGDMSEDQIGRRLGSLIARRPIFGDKNNPIKIPTKLITNDDTAIVEHEERLFPDNLSEEAAWAAVQKFAMHHGEDLLKLSVHRSRAISALQIEQKVDEWCQAGWVPDIVGIDYMDLLAPIYGRTETRDEINETWQAARAMAMKFHCCVVGPTQSDSASYNQRSMQRGNFSGDRRKNDHVTAMIGINQTAEEKEQQLYRLNFVHGRDLDFTAELTCAACLGLSNPAVLTSC